MQPANRGSMATNDYANNVKSGNGSTMRVSRRQWLTRAGVACAGVTPIGVLMSSQQKSDKTEEEEVSPPEDLMREHGVLKRVLLVYEEAIRRIDAKQELPPDSIR